MGFGHLSLPAAFGAGLLSFMAPCVLPLVPAYLCFLGGRTLEELNAECVTRDACRRVGASALFFVLGFSAVFIAMGASASYIGGLIADNLRWFAMAAGAGIIVLGLHYTGLFRIGFLNRDIRLHVARRPAGLLGAFAVGMAFAFGWTPCVGPVLATILIVAAQKNSMIGGITLLAAYAAGLGLPFLIAAVAVRPFLAWRERVRKHMRKCELVIGGLLMGTGVLMLVGGLANVSQILLQVFPALGKVG
jgi:cytochrome c-type biogenesis protein